ncbi:MAG: ShlB/FhaC/HecB family hemolysin secretion/activation protein [Immundisolibacteraceae bacterium]|nr:ShlB/FhaC/HecB family hemolysin secretion/activation protein [Immundisolibacteraceae bacterium]
MIIHGLGFVPNGVLSSCLKHVAFAVIVLGLPVAAIAAVVPDAVGPGGVMQTTQRPERVERPGPGPALIPAVVRRPLAVDDGPKIAVDKFVVVGVEDEEEVAAVNELVEAARVARGGEFTFGQMQLVADQITAYYRSRGMILAQAFVPEQEVVEAVVQLRVMAGNLGSVFVEDNERYSAESVKNPFRALIGQAVESRQVESALLRVSDLPGLSAFGVFQPGSVEGTTDLSLKVTEKALDAVVGFNNYGTEFTGEYQGHLDLSVNNPMGIGDQLQLGFQQAYRPKLAEFGYFNYHLPVFSGWVDGLRAGLGFSRNEFEVGGDLKAIGIEGITEIASVYLDKSWVRSRRANFSTKFDFSRKQSKVFIAGTDFSQDVLAVASLEFSMDFIDNLLGGGINQGLVTLHHGFGNVLASTQANDLPGSGRRDLDGDSLGAGFDKVTFDFSRLQNIVPNHSLIVHVSGQFSDDLLGSLEQMSIGGPFSVRAYPQAEFLVDKGFFGSLEWVMNAPGFANKIAFENKTWGEILQVSIFIDHATGWVDESVIEDQIEVTGAGVGLQAFVPANVVATFGNYLATWFSQEWQLYFPGELSLRLDVATPIGKRDATNSENPQIFFNTTYTY